MSSAELTPRRIAAETKTVRVRQDVIPELLNGNESANSFSQEPSSRSQSLTRHHSSLQGRRDICRAGPSGCTMKLSEKLEPMPCSGSYSPGSTEKAMPGSSMV